MVEQTTTDASTSNKPTRLLEMIEDVNLVPPDAVLPEWSPVFDRFLDERLPGETKEQREENFNRAVVLTFEECFKDFSEETKNRWLQASLDYHLSVLPERNPEDLAIPAMLYVIVHWYKDTRRRRDELRRIAEYFARLRQSTVNITGGEGLSESDRESLQPPELNVELKITGTTMEVVMSGLAEAINGVDGDRIRICEICNRIFWAKRKDSMTCSPACFNTLRQRRYRNENREKLRAERRARYEHNKKLKRIRKKKDGSL